LHANGGSLRRLAKASSMPRGAFEGKKKKKKKKPPWSALQ
jgi:hypothetical protein